MALVALLAEGVDRNLAGNISAKKYVVALLAEGVDRNLPNMSSRSAMVVALLAEGVDRNRLLPDVPLQLVASPSSRRAWIEISGVISET